MSCDLVIDLQAMDQVIEHAAGDLVARVQAGTTMGNLASVLASAGQQLAVDAPADATVGGVVATGTAGPRRFRYGAPRDLLIGITWSGPTGWSRTRAARWSRTWPATTSASCSPVRRGRWA